MPSDDTLKNAAIGAVASIVLFFLPFSPALGGALAGYLQGDDTDEGLRVGALSGAIAAVPLALLAVLVVAFFAVVGLGFGRAMLGFVVVFLAVLAIALVYGVGLGALGGLVGAYLHDEFDRAGGTGSERARTPPEREPARERRSEPTEFDEPMDDRTDEGERRR